MMSDGYRQINEVLDIEGICTCLRTMQGGSLQPKVLVNVNEGKSQVRDDFNCLDANYFKGLDNHAQRTGVMEIVRAGHLESDSGNTGIIYDPSGIAPTQLAQHGNAVTKIIDDQGRTKKKLELLDTCPTLRAQSHGNEPKVTNGYRIRKLTPLECWRLQGQPDENFYKAKAAGVSDSQLYKQAGNSVTTYVIAEIASRMEMEVAE